MIYSIVILYNPDINIKSNEYENIVKNSDYTFFVDNSNCDNLEYFASYDPKKINYIALNANLGIASAQNVALRKILSISSNDSDRVIFFDQDSCIDDSFISELSNSFKALKDRKVNIGLLGPLPVNKNTGQKYPIKASVTRRLDFSLPDNYITLDCLISSGSMTSVYVLKKCGLMMDELFIDSVDHEWSWRVLNHGFSNFIDSRITMEHLFGDGDLSFLGMKIRKGSPVRYYYSFRNWFYLFRLGYVPLKYKIFTVLKIPFKFFIYLYVFDEKLVRLKFMSKGIFHGLIKRFGPY